MGEETGSRHKTPGTETGASSLIWVDLTSANVTLIQSFYLLSIPNSNFHFGASCSQTYHVNITIKRLRL